jgi:hypothetical protein
MASVTKAYGFNGSGPTAASVDSADSASFKFGRDDTVISTTPVPVPTATGTNFSWRKYLGLYVVSGGGSTSLLNRGVKMSGALPTGIQMWQSAVTTYVQATTTQGTAAGNRPTDSGSNAATPANQTDVTWVLMTTSNVTYDASTVAATNTTINGKYLALVLGVDFTCASGGGSTSLNNVILQYDEQLLDESMLYSSYDEDILSSQRGPRLARSFRRGGMPY